MEQGWLHETPKLTANEADHLVELWLRKRLLAPDQTPLDTSKLSLRELAIALGTTEQELALMLCDIRDKRTRKGLPKQHRKPMSVSRTLIFIAGIYVGLVGLSFFMWNMGFNSGRSGAAYYGYNSGPTTWSRPTPTSYYDRNLPNHTPLTQAVGFQYRDIFCTSSQGIGIENGEWDQIQKALEEAVTEYSGSESQPFVEAISKKDIDKALAAGDGVIPEIPKQPRYGSRIMRQPELPSSLKEGPYVGWDVFTVDVEGRRISTPMPRPKVANPDLEKAIRARVGQTIAKLLDTLRAGKQATPNPPVIR